MPISLTPEIETPKGRKFNPNIQITNKTPEEIVFELTGSYPRQYSLNDRLRSLIDFSFNQIYPRVYQLRKACMAMML